MGSESTVFSVIRESSRPRNNIRCSSRTLGVLFHYRAGAIRPRRTPRSTENRRWPEVAAVSAVSAVCDDGAKAPVFEEAEADDFRTNCRHPPHCSATGTAHDLPALGATGETLGSTRSTTRAARATRDPVDEGRTVTRNSICQDLVHSSQILVNSNRSTK